MSISQFDLKVGFSCNNDCIHCVVADKRKTPDQTTYQIKEIINLVPPNIRIIFTGGEPTIRPDFLELIQYAKNKKHPVWLQTNGTGLADKELAKEAVKYLDHILLAIHSCHEDIHDKIVRSSGMCKKTIQGFKNIITYQRNCASQVILGTQTVISGWNYESLLDTMSFIQRLAPRISMNLTFPHPLGNAYRYNSVVVPKYSIIKPFIQRCLAAYAQYINTEAIPICYLYPYQDICQNGDLNLIDNISNAQLSGFDPANRNVSSFNPQGMVKDYRPLTLSSKRKLETCSKCMFDRICVGVWKEYLAFYSEQVDLYPVV